MYDKDFSVIIPHRDSVSLLAKLFASIPVSEKIEVILVDNSPIPVSREMIGVNRDYQLLYSAPERGAGGARNVGIEHAHGKWLIFADADDYFTEDAFDTFFSMKDTKAEIVFTCMGGAYIDTGERASRGDIYTRMVKDYLAGKKSEMSLRLGFSSPCCKMISHDLVRREHIQFDEVKASNDVYFSLLTGYYAKTIEAIDKISYIATVSRGTLTQRRDLSVVESRFRVKLRYNQFVKNHGYPNHQKSVMNQVRQIVGFGPRVWLHFGWLLIQYRQNPLIGWHNWKRTWTKVVKQENKDKRYRVK